MWERKREVVQFSKSMKKTCTGGEAANTREIFSTRYTRYNILERSIKAYAILAEIRAISIDVPLGKYRVEAGQNLRQAMFLNGVLFNSEVWQQLHATDLTMLQTVDHR